MTIEENDKDLLSQQVQEAKEPSLSALVLLSSPFIEYRNNKPVPVPILELNKEKDLLEEKLRKVNAGLFVDLVPAATHILQEKLMDDTYKILHFIGHGTDEEKGGLYFEDKYGAAHILNQDDLKQLLKGKDIWLLVLNACHSEKIAAKLKDIGIRAIICIDRKETILDKSAIIFSALFYAALGRGMKVRNAFEEGKKAVRLEPEIKEYAQIEDKKYKLIPKEGGNFSLIDKDTSTSYASSAIENKTLNLPPLPYTFVGRGKEIVEVNKALLDSKPVITLKGLPGVGKTTLATKVGYWHKIHPHLDANIIFVDCTKQTSQHKMLEEIGKGIFGEDFYSIEENMREERVVKKLNDLQYLLILDNFEDVEEKDLSGRFLKRIERSKVIITSREDTGLRGFEEIIEVPLLSKEEGIRLFLQHAKGIGYKIKKIDLEIISEIVEILEGLPLAVELSARQLSGAYNLQSLLKDIKEKMTQILRDETLIGEEKNKNLTVSFSISYRRLSDEGKELFKRFSIFRGVVGKEAVDKVCQIRDSQEGMGELIRNSLIQKKDSMFYMLASLRDYGQRLLLEEDKRHYHQRAANYFASLPLHKREKRRGKRDILPLLEAHYHACQAENYLQAYLLIFDNGLDKDLRIWGESVTLLELCKEIPETPSLLPGEKESALLNAIGMAYYDLSQFKKAIEYFRQALDIAREIEDRWWVNTLFGNLGSAHCNLGQFKKAIEYHKQGFDIAREIGDKQSEGSRLGNLGVAYGGLGQFDKEIEYLQQALDIAREIGDRRNEGAWLGNLGVAYKILGQFEKAIEHYHQAVDIAREIGDREGEVFHLGNLGVAYDGLGQFDKAIEYLQQALDIAREIGDRLNEGRWLGNLGAVYYKLGQFDNVIEYLQQALDIAREIEDRWCEGVWLNNLGEVYTKQTKYDLALSHLLQSKNIQAKIKDPRLKDTEENINKLKELLGKAKFQELFNKIEAKLLKD